MVDFLGFGATVFNALMAYPVIGVPVIATVLCVDCYLVYEMVRGKKE